VIPALGSKKLDAITNEHVQRVKRGLVDRAAKTANGMEGVAPRRLRNSVAGPALRRTKR